MADVLQIREERRMQQWQQIIQACQASGQTNRAYCQEHGISEKAYYYWLKKLRAAMAESGSAVLVPLKQEETEPREMLHIRFGRAEMRLPANTDIDAIAAVLRSIQQQW